MRYLLWAGKLGLMVFWLALLNTWMLPVARPFALLLGLLCMTTLLAHLLSIMLCNRLLRGRHAWLERLQLLLFGAFSRPAMPEEAGASQPPSEARTDSSQAD